MIHPMLLVVGAFLISSAPSSSQPLPDMGASTQYKTEDGLGNYAFGYSEDHSGGGSFRTESGDLQGNKVGSYGLHGADGRARVVNYVADSAGFRADVHTNEPGVDPHQDPAHVAVNKPALAVLSHPVAVNKPPLAVLSHPVVHKTVLGPPVVAVTSHHHAVNLLHGVYHAPVMHAVVGHHHVSHMLLG